MLVGAPDDSAHQLQAWMPVPTQINGPQRAHGAACPLGGQHSWQLVGCMRWLGRTLGGIAFLRHLAVVAIQPRRVDNGNSSRATVSADLVSKETVTYPVTSDNRRNIISD